MFRIFASRKRSSTRGRDVSADTEPGFIERHIAMTAHLEPKKRVQHCVVKGFGEWDLSKGKNLLPLLREVSA